MSFRRTCRHPKRSWKINKKQQLLCVQCYRIIGTVEVKLTKPRVKAHVIYEGARGRVF